MCVIVQSRVRNTRDWTLFFQFAEKTAVFIITLLTPFLFENACTPIRKKQTRPRQAVGRGKKLEASEFTDKDYKHHNTLLDSPIPRLNPKLCSSVLVLSFLAIYPDLSSPLPNSYQIVLVEIFLSELTTEPAWFCAHPDNQSF